MAMTTEKKTLLQNMGWLIALTIFLVTCLVGAGQYINQQVNNTKNIGTITISLDSQGKIIAQSQSDISVLKSENQNIKEMVTDIKNALQENNRLLGQLIAVQKGRQ